MKHWSRRLRGAASTITLLGGALSVAAQTPQPAARYPDVAVFKSATDGANFPSEPSLDLSKVATIEFWVQPRWTTPPPQDPCILSNLGFDGPRYAVLMTGDRKAIGLHSGPDWHTVAFDFTDKKLHHVAFVIADKLTQVYIDGTKIDTILQGVADTPSRGFHIGTMDGVGSPFYGAIAGVRIWNTAVDPKSLAEYNFIDIFSDEGRKHPNFDALAGASAFSKTDRTFRLTAAYRTAADLAAANKDAWINGVSQDPVPPAVVPSGAGQ